MEMPTPCVTCDETFDLNSGRCGLTHKTSNITICNNCHSNQQEQKNRIDEIRQALESKSDNESNIESWTDQVNDLQQNIENARLENESLDEELNCCNYNGVDDNYHTLINEFY